MWVHRSGEFHTKCPIVIYEYQKGRNHEFPLQFYQNYEGILVTDGLSQYHLLENTAVPLKGKTAEGLKYSLNQEKYLKVFLTDGNVPIDNSASLSTGYFYPHLFGKCA